MVVVAEQRARRPWTLSSVRLHRKTRPAGVGRHDQGARRDRRRHSCSWTPRTATWPRPGRSCKDGARGRRGASGGCGPVNQRHRGRADGAGRRAAALDPESTGGSILYTPQPGPGRRPRGHDRPPRRRSRKEQLRVVSIAHRGGFGARIACDLEQIVVVALGARQARPRRAATSRRARRRCCRCSMVCAQVQDVDNPAGCAIGKGLTGLRLRRTADAAAHPARRRADADADWLYVQRCRRSSRNIDFDFDCAGHQYHAHRRLPWRWAAWNGDGAAAAA